MIALTVIHSTGINWGQALATWIPIVLTVIGSIVAGIRSYRKWRDTQQTRIEVMVDKSVDKFGLVIGGRLDRIDTHLGKQDERLGRIDRNTGTNST